MNEIITNNMPNKLIIERLDEDYIHNLEENFHIGIKRAFDIMSDIVSKDRSESEEEI